MDAPRVLLVADGPVEERLRAAVPELNGNLRRWTGSLTELCAGGAFADLMSHTPDVVAFGPELPTETVLELAGDLDRLHPQIVTILLTDPSPLLWERAARAGVREMLSISADDTDLQLAMKRTFATVEARNGRSRPAEVQAADAQRAVVVVRSPKGGSGKTMVATNLAVTLAKLFPGDVVLVDLDLQFGDVSSALGVEPHYTIADATANVDLTPTSLKASLSKHPSNLYALCAPPQPDDAEAITGDDVTAVLALLKTAFRFVVIDTAAGTDECTLAALQCATDVVLLCSMDVSSVRALAKDVERSTTRSDAHVRAHVVLNRGDSRVALEPRDIEATLGREIDVHLPSSRSVPLHMNCGVPVVEAEPASAITKQLREIVNCVVPAASEASGRAKRRGWRR